MKYDLTTPCGTCPFRKSTNFDFCKERIEEILFSNGGFSCHKSTTEKGRSNRHKEAQACAGRMILLEKANRPDQMMRICERLGMYDRTKLDMKNKDVFGTISGFIRARLTRKRD